MAEVAFITGGNGITGSAIIEYLVKNTTSAEWSKIIVTSRSPFKTTVHDDRITFMALDLTEGAEILNEMLRIICQDVTHACFSSYVHKDDIAQLNQANEELFSNFLDTPVWKTTRHRLAASITTSTSVRSVSSSGGKAEERESTWQLLLPTRRLSDHRSDWPEMDVKLYPARGHYRSHPEAEWHELHLGVRLVLSRLQGDGYRGAYANEPAQLGRMWRPLGL